MTGWVLASVHEKLSKSERRNFIGFIDRDCVLPESNSNLFPCSCLSFPLLGLKISSLVYELRVVGSSHIDL